MAEGDSLERVTAEVVDCFKCPRLVAWREQVGREKRAAYQHDDYWARPIPGFGDPLAELLLVGLAPAAHGGNRTGRIFTGDRSGDWLYGALYRHGFANQAESVSRDDGLRVQDVYICAAARCAPPDNKPTPEELARCRPYMSEELGALTKLRVVIALGGIAWEAVLRAWMEEGHGIPRPRPKFGHGAVARVAPDLPVLLGSYHPSQQNTQTGRLTQAMFDSVFARAKQLIEEER